MVLSKKQKLLISLAGILLVALLLVFSIKGKNSFKNRFLDAYDKTTSAISIESQHDWLRFSDFVHGYDQSKPTKLGWVTDIHADRFKRRTVESGTLFPKSYSEYLPKVFDELRFQGINTVLATWDNVNSGDEGYGEELAKIAYRKNMQVLWVKGNHDSDASMRKLGLTGDNFYYAKDFGQTRVVVLDDSVQAYEAKSMDAEQFAWLKDTLVTDKKVVVAMHVPIFPVTQEARVLSQDTELEKILRDSGKVGLVLSGHFHVKWNKQFDGLNFFGESALTRENELGGYGIIDLNKMSVQYLYTK